MIQTARARRGTSLIEVLVVLVVLVIGILAIARLFPAGFVALRNAENSSYADRLAEGALEQLKQDNGSLADAVYMYTDALGFDPNVAPDDLFAFVPDANGYNNNPSHSIGNLSDPFNNVNKQRYISNETFTVGGNRAISANFPLYFLTYGPITLPDTTNLGNYLIVNGLNWTPRTGDARTNPGDTNRTIDEPQDILEPNQSTFMVDYGQGKLAVPQAHYDQIFTAIVQPVTGAAATVSLDVHSQDAASGAYNGDWFDITGSTATVSNAVSINGTLPAGPWSSVTLYRPFQYKGATQSPNFDADPYEFALYTPNVAQTNMGVLAFNPAAAGRGTGTQALKARLSYMALDWHVLHEDHDVAAGDASGGPTIRLRLSHLKKVGDIQFDNSIYGGLLTGATGTSQYDVLMMDLDTGAIVGLNGNGGANTQDVDQNDSLPTNLYGVSYQNGRVTFPANSPAQRVRFFYSGDADWAVSVQKAPSFYTAVPTAAALTVPGPTPNRCFPVTPDRIYFPLCDAGKTVEFDGITYTAGGAARQIGQGTATISTDTADPGNGLAAVYVNLTSAGLNSSSVIADTPDAGSFKFNAVRGVSARATVIWRERNTWRSRTLDTLLTQTP